MPHIEREGVDQTHHLSSKDEDGRTALHRAAGRAKQTTQYLMTHRAATPTARGENTDPVPVALIFTMNTSK